MSRVLQPRRAGWDKSDEAGIWEGKWEFYEVELDFDAIGVGELGAGDPRVMGSLACASCRRRGAVSQPSARFSP